MTFQDFLEHAEALFKKEVPGAGLLPFSKTHVFNLGEDEKIEDGIRDIWEDLKSDMAERVPMPFKDTTCMSIVPMETGEPGWVLDRIVEVPLMPQELEYLKNVEAPPQSTPAQREAMKRLRQKFVVIRVEEGWDYVSSWIIYFFGVVDRALVMVVTPTQHMMQILRGSSSPKMDAFLDKESHAVIKQASAISHPANYVIQVTPELTPKESRKVEAGRERPIRKKPHYIVVDHEIVVRMSRGTGEHSSPVPHERRGHWRRLAEHCRLAREGGKEKTWVRPTYVGETSFSDEKNKYEVLMDFGRNREIAEVR